MKTDHLRKSNNVEDRRGQSGSLPGGNYGRQGGMSGGNILLPLLFSRMGWKGKLLLLLLLLVFAGGGMGNLLGGDTGYSSYQSTQVGTPASDVTDDEAEFVSKVLASTEDFWTEEFRRHGQTYNAPKLVFYTGQTHTACGVGQASSGPFYCSADRTVYLDISFYRELTTKYRAKGDFAMAYVIAHEVGHHVQNESGIMNQYARSRQGMSEKQANELTVRLELQADYYAGAWAKYVDGLGYLDVGDIEEAMAAAHAVGDDTLQKEAYGRVVPDSFTHGTSEQRKRWFDRGYQYGDIEHGDTFNAVTL
ncbi:neutral zinc metallopeptidase [Streptococcus sp. E24BD]|uniref:KPN_02809 family neutral zinc metallopeptidase n=1 Tax=Streptococcus sp. E24BD TaxID=3278715 RepID=UPI00359DA0B7